MRKIALMALISLPLFSGFFPQTVHTSISKIKHNSITLSASFPVSGMSGVVVHDYGNELEAITGVLVQNASSTTLINSDIVHHDELPTIKTKVKAGDKVIGGYLYNNVLLLAPDAKTYANITSQHAKNWIHPDLFALFLARENDAAPNRKNLASFARSHQVGLVYIVANGTAKLLDPISGKIVGQKSLTGLPKVGKLPFFMRLDEIKTGWFGSGAKGNYYQIMGNI